MRKSILPITYGLSLSDGGTEGSVGGSGGSTVYNVEELDACLQRGLHSLDRLFAVAGAEHCKSQPHQHHAGDIDDDVIVIHQQYRTARPVFRGASRL